MQFRGNPCLASPSLQEMDCWFTKRESLGSKGEQKTDQTKKLFSYYAERPSGLVVWAGIEPATQGFSVVENIILHGVIVAYLTGNQYWYIILSYTNSQGK